MTYPPVQGVPNLPNVDARKSLSLIYNLQTYADIMSAFAAGERYINRVWSASADGYIDEIMEYLERAFEQFRDAGQQLQDAQEKAKQVSS